LTDISIPESLSLANSFQDRDSLGRKRSASPNSHTSLGNKSLSLANAFQEKDFQ
jgi:hypothetical protein